MDLPCSYIARLNVEMIKQRDQMQEAQQHPKAPALYDEVDKHRDWIAPRLRMHGDKARPRARAQIARRLFTILTAFESPRSALQNTPLFVRYG
ncbi:hypothetical protein LTS18_003689 [Coniosporium uncinatum]|uniref:Uncharacterized protein n=1 Tax=Coniosporium uncinatum TaxID=93489 RepID=A0ACC3D6R2_9PEZI|nr:hypothetical protein LTS18_003689 [Coniosporium uncinatum]